MASLGWYAQRYKAGAYKAGQKATCRTCKEPIYFLIDDDTTRSRVHLLFGMWLHMDTNENNLETAGEAHKHRAEPMEFCVESMGSTLAHDVCGVPVKFEDKELGFYACGRHRKIFEEKANARKVREEREARERAAQELLEYEFPFYEEAEVWLRERLPGLFAESDHAAERYKSNRYGRPTTEELSITRKVRVDWVQLKNLLEGRLSDDLRVEVRTHEHDAQDSAVLPWDD